MKGQRGQQPEIMYKKGDMEMGKQTAWEEIDKKSSEDLYRQRRDLGLRGDCLHGRKVDEDPLRCSESRRFYS